MRTSTCLGIRTTVSSGLIWVWGRRWLGRRWHYGSWSRSGDLVEAEVLTPVLVAKVIWFSGGSWRLHIWFFERVYWKVWGNENIFFLHVLIFNFFKDLFAMVCLWYYINKCDELIFIHSWNVKIHWYNRDECPISFQKKNSYKSPKHI